MKNGAFAVNDGWKSQFDLGMKYGGQGKLRKAARCFTKAIDSAPGEPYPHYELGYTLTLLGDFRGALREFLRADDISPAFLQVQTEIFMCNGLITGALCSEIIPAVRTIQHQIDIGKFEGREATETALCLIKLAPNCPLSYYYLSIALDDREIAMQESALRRCLALKPDETTAIYAFARLICLLRNDARDKEADELSALLKRRFANNAHLELIADLLHDRRESNITALYSLHSRLPRRLNNEFQRQLR